MSDLITWLVMAGLTFVVIGIPVILMVLPLLNLLVSYVTDGDYPEMFMEVDSSSYNTEYRYKVFGGTLTLIFEMVFLYIPLMSAIVCLFYLAMVNKAFIRGLNVEGYTFMVNPASEFISALILLILMVGGSLFTAKILYVGGKKVAKVSAALNDHIKDKEAHK